MITLFLVRSKSEADGREFSSKLLESCLVDQIISAHDYFNIPDQEQACESLKMKEAKLWCQERARIVLRRGYNAAVVAQDTKGKEVETYRNIARECESVFVNVIVETFEGRNI